MRRTLLLFALVFITLVHGQILAPSSVTLCTDEEVRSALAAVGTYQPTELTTFIKLKDGELTLGDQAYQVRGINYYPARYPWRRFLTETDTETLHRDFALMREAQINTLRIFLWQYALFTCPGEQAVPHRWHFERLDTIFRTAAKYGFRLIVTLNDSPDFDAQPLYEYPQRIQNEIRFIVERYKDEPAILAWDLRNEGDIDYGSHPTIWGRFTREKVLSWLDNVSTLVQQLDPNHLITAGWLYHAQDTAPYVDFISFHHWKDVPDLQHRIEEITSSTNKPILLEEFGYSDFNAEMTPEVQAKNIQAIIEYVEQERLLGWMIWTAFDFPFDTSCYPSPCQSQDSAEHHFGIWYSDYTEKPAVEILRRLADK